MCDRTKKIDYRLNTEKGSFQDWCSLAMQIVSNYGIVLLLLCRAISSVLLVSHWQNLVEIFPLAQCFCSKKLCKCEQPVHPLQ
jgi:hypothetical protein